MSHPRPRSARLSVEALEDRTTPTFLSRPGGRINVNNVDLPAGGLSIAAGNLLPDNLAGGLVQNEYVTGTGPGTEGKVRVWRLNGQTNGLGTPALTITPFAGFTGGLNVAVGDVVGDGTPEIIVGVASNGPPLVRVYSATGQLLSTFLAFDASFMGGVNVAVGNVLGGIGAGGYSGGTVSRNFKQEIIIGAAAGSTPHVVVTNSTGTVFRSFLAFDIGYRGGVTVAAGSIDTTRSTAFNTTGVDNNAYDEIIVGAATNVPHVKAFSVNTGAIVERLSFFAYDPGSGQGVTVAAGSTDNVLGAEIYVSQITPRASQASPTVRLYGLSNNTAQFRLEFAPYPPSYTHVVNMVVAYLTPPSRGPIGYDPSDDDSSGGSNFDFLTQDLALVSGDASFQQEPRFFIGLGPTRPAGSSGPPP